MTPKNRGGVEKNKHISGKYQKGLKRQKAKMF
jgi:hypothetical protein